MKKHGHVVHRRVEVNVEQKKDTVLIMMTALGILNVEQEIAKIKIHCQVFPWVLTAATTLLKVR